jgi:hypothetical protein
VFGSVRKSLAVLRKELEQVRRGTLHMGPSRKERQIMARMAELLTREEIMEKQRSRIDCLRDGDLRTMCGSRTGGWSLPCVMSD